MHDASIIYSALPEHPWDFFRMIFGLHNELESDELYKNYFHLMDKWHRPDGNAFFLNDNRSITRLNAVIMIFSFNHYPVHALFMMVFSFIGQFLLFKTFVSYFKQKEFLLFLILFLTPSLYFWTSGVLKEPVTLLLMGVFVYSFFQLFIFKNKKTIYYISILLSVICFSMMKPYVLMMILIPLIIFTWVEKKQGKRIGLTYFSITLGLMLLSMTALKVIFHKDIFATMVKRQNDFINLSYGGRYFETHEKWIRFEYNDSTMLDRVSPDTNLFRFKAHAKYNYWLNVNFDDTIHVFDNQDTLTEYPMVSVCPPSGSCIQVEPLKYSATSFLKMIPVAYFNVVFRPLFFDADSAMAYFSSFENFLIMVIVLISLIFGTTKNISWNLFFFFLYVVLMSYLLIGMTTTVSGAIVRYKVLFLPYFMMIPLLFLNPSVIQKIPFLNRMINKQ